jgi:hypothetical protein
MANLRIYCAYNCCFDDKDQVTVNRDRFDYTEWQRELWKGKII